MSKNPLQILRKSENDCPVPSSGCTVADVTQHLVDLDLAMPGKLQVYKSKQHSCQLLKGFQQLMEHERMCDTQLVVEKQVFSVHRCFLAACSDYFYSMFTEEFQEMNQKCVELKGVTPVGLKILLKYAYSGQIALDSATLQEVLEAAAHLQFTEVLEFCSDYLTGQLTIDNCLQFLQMADMYNLTICQRDIKKFILLNFPAVAKNDDFNDISKSLLCEFLKDDRLTSDSELEVFMISLAWLKERKEEKIKLSAEVLSLIRYGLMSQEEMETVYRNELMLTESCHPILTTAISYQMNLFSQPMKHGDIARMRAAADCLVVLGAGKTDNILCSHILAARMQDEGKLQEFQKLSPVKDKRYFAAVVVMNNFVFVVGGQAAMAGDGSHATNTAHRYNSRDGKWLQLQSMRIPRTHFALVALEDCLIAVGGKHNRLALNTVEKYIFQKNEWFMVATLPSTLFSHAGCSFNNKLYISGGCPGEDFTDHFHSYDTERDGWTLLSPLNQSRGYHIMVPYNDKIYVCAGNTNAGNRADVLYAEVYDPDHDQWTQVSCSNHGQSEAPAVAWDKHVYIVGGYSWNQRSFQDILHRYCLEDDTWELLDIRLPEPMTGVVACKLQLPLQLFKTFQEFSK